MVVIVFHLFVYLFIYFISFSPEVLRSTRQTEFREPIFSDTLFTAAKYRETGFCFYFWEMQLSECENTF